jgi:hypothetical protein
MSTVDRSYLYQKWFHKRSRLWDITYKWILACLTITPGYDSKCNSSHFHLLLEASFPRDQPYDPAIVIVTAHGS